MSQTRSIGELARITDTRVETIRYYERIGLLPEPARTAGNYRAYSDRHMGRLSFIRRARSLGFPLDQVRQLLALASATMSTVGTSSTPSRKKLLYISRSPCNPRFRG